jgi:hypothetical protein
MNPYHQELVFQYLYGIPQETKDRLLHQIRLMRVLGIFNACVGEWNSLIDRPSNDEHENCIPPNTFWMICSDIMTDTESTLYQMPRYDDNPHRFFWVKH